MEVLLPCSLLRQSPLPAVVHTFRVWDRCRGYAAYANPPVAPLAGGPVWAAGQGQEQMDKATDVKLNAVTISDLSEVIRLSDARWLKGSIRGTSTLPTSY